MTFPLAGVVGREPAPCGSRMGRTKCIASRIGKLELFALPAEGIEHGAARALTNFGRIMAMRNLMAPATNMFLQTPRCRHGAFPPQAVPGLLRQPW